MAAPIRRTLKRIEQPHQGRYLTFSCYHRLALLSNDRIKDALMERLALVKGQMRFHLHAWVIMPEHVHLIVRTGSPKLTVEQILHRLKSPFARRVLDRWRELGADILPRISDRQGIAHFWQTGGGYDRNLISEKEWLEKINYIHNNPVRRRLVRSAIDWRWSSARWYEGNRADGPSIDPL